MALWNEGHTVGAEGRPAARGAVSTRRRALHLAARIAPRLVGRLLARRYLSPASHLDPAHVARHGAQLVRIGAETALVRHAAPHAGAPRVLLVPGHDGQMRQFSRLVRDLRRAGAAVDLLILPGHLHPARTLCSLADIIPAIRRCIEAHGPYNGVGAHCVGARSLLFALGEGLACPRAALISTPVDLPGLIRLGGTQYGLTGAALAQFEAGVTRLCAPYDPATDWRPAATSRRGETLVIHARHDYAAPVAGARALAEAMPGTRLEVFEEGDHNTILNHAPASRMLAEFLAGA
ncbi:alpha/beta hydrolase [Salipiger pacificus]|nr:alpha/beta hydrolase [Alloyangia pacifica]MCA0943798.1 alpha/beta hydrolase [Alloyangia pacifica]